MKTSDFGDDDGGNALPNALLMESVFTALYCLGCLAN